MTLMNKISRGSNDEDDDGKDKALLNADNDGKAFHAMSKISRGPAEASIALQWLRGSTQVDS